MRELLPCPFCGGKPSMAVGYHARFDVKIMCDDCGAEGALFGTDDFKGINGSAPYEKRAIDAWNRRAPHQQENRSELWKGLQER